MPVESLIKIDPSKGQGVGIDEYQGNISLVAGYEGKDGKIQLEWVRGQHYDKEAKKKVPDDKDRPLKIYLGSKERAIEVLEALLWQLGVEIHQKEARPAEEDEVPF